MRHVMVGIDRGCLYALSKSDVPVEEGVVIGTRSTQCQKILFGTKQAMKVNLVQTSKAQSFRDCQ